MSKLTTKLIAAFIVILASCGSDASTVSTVEVPSTTLSMASTTLGSPVTTIPTPATTGQGGQATVPASEPPEQEPIVDDAEFDRRMADALATLGAIRARSSTAADEAGPYDITAPMVFLGEGACPMLETEGGEPSTWSYDFYELICDHSAGPYSVSVLVWDPEAIDEIEASLPQPEVELDLETVEQTTVWGGDLRIECAELDGDPGMQYMCAQKWQRDGIELNIAGGEVLREDTTILSDALPDAILRIAQLDPVAFDYVPPDEL